MKKVYLSAVVKLKNEVSPVVGVEIIDQGYNFDELKKAYQFIINRYFGEVKIIAFGRITKKEYTQQTNIRMSE